MATVPSVCEFGWKAPEFSLASTKGASVTLTNAKGPSGLLVMFICNHCPYVLAVLDRIMRDTDDLKALGVGVVAISSNDVTSHPQDSFENMAKMADERSFSFPYLYDETQEVARAYDATCTPDFFGFNGKLELQYRGRLDASTSKAGPADLRRDLFEAMKQVAQTGRGPKNQIAPMGCSIKWKTP
jgi:peroxiredoxin